VGGAYTITYDLLVLRISCRQLLELTCQIANALKTEGVKKGDRVAIYMPVSPQLAASMLACARIGAVHRWVTLMLGAACISCAHGVRTHDQFVAPWLKKGHMLTTQGESYQERLYGCYRILFSPYNCLCKNMQMIHE